MDDTRADDVARTGAPGLSTLTALVGAVLLGGSNFVAVRFSNRELDPLWGAGVRFSVAAAVFGLLVGVLQLRLPRGAALRLLLAYGLLAFGASYGLLYWGMQEVPAGVAAVVMAAGPLLTLLLATAQGMETLHLRALVGSVLALVGSALMFFQQGEYEFSWVRLAAVCVAAATAAESVVVAKRCGPEHPVVMNFVGMAVGGAVLLAASALRGEDWVLPQEPATFIAVAYLVAASVLMFVLMLVVVQRWTASASAYVFVLMPPVAIVLGAALGDAPVTTVTVVGGVVVLLGTVLGARKGRVGGSAHAPTTRR